MVNPFHSYFRPSNTVVAAEVVKGFLQLILVGSEGI